MTDDTIVLRVNGADYKRFITASVTKSLDAIGGSFNFDIANDNYGSLPIYEQDSAEIFINGTKVITGYIQKAGSRYSKDSHSFKVSGYDKTVDVVQSSITQNIQFNAPISLKEIIERTLQAEGFGYIKVIDKANPDLYNKADIIAPQTGESLFDFFDKHANERAVLLNSDGNGNIVIYRNDGQQTTVSLSNKVGKKNTVIIEASYEVDYENRFRTVTIKSQQGKNVNLQATSVDEEVVLNRNLALTSDKQVGIAELQTIADFEVNKRRADSETYTCKVYGYWAASGLIWQPNIFCHVDDDFAECNDTFLCKEANFGLTIEEGHTTELTFVPQDAYLPSAKDMKRALRRKHKKGKKGRHKKPLQIIGGTVNEADLDNYEAGLKSSGAMN